MYAADMASLLSFSPAFTVWHYLAGGSSMACSLSSLKAGGSGVGMQPCSSASFTPLAQWRGLTLDDHAALKR